MLKSVLTKEQCAGCRICCSFTMEDVWEAPVLTNFQTKEKYRAEYNFKTSEEILLCPMLNEKEGCILGDNKPFECKIWPLRVFRDENHIKIGIAKICPAFSEQSDEKLIELLRGGLYDAINEECKRNPEIVKESADGYRMLKI